MQNDPITKEDLNKLEKFADEMFGKLGIDVNFTKHFLDRVNDERNKKQITYEELSRLFREEYSKWGKKIAQLGPDKEAILKDMKTNINLSFNIPEMRYLLISLLMYFILLRSSSNSDMIQLGLS